MLTLAAALAFGQPQLSAPLLPPPPVAAYGWMGDLAGSCFAWRSRNGVHGRRECFSLVGGFLVQTSHLGLPHAASRQVCRYEALASSAGAFMLHCVGTARFTQTARVDGDRVVIRLRDDRSAVRRPLLSGGVTLERSGPNRLRLFHEGNLELAASQAIILSRIAAD